MKFKDFPDHARSIIQQMTEHNIFLHNHRSLRRPFTSHYRKGDKKVERFENRMVKFKLLLNKFKKGVIP